MAKIIVGMSGGVDSSVAALLLKRAGHDVAGLFMKNWEDDDTEEYCSSRQDLIDAAAAADVIGIDLEVVNFSAEYKDRVFADFLREYQAGRTPNPDVLCNSEIKFTAFLDHALKLGADLIATGHYARVREFIGKFQLMKAEDGTKDQSYFLYRLNQAQLSKTLFPVGHLYKRDVRRIAGEAGLPNHAKKDSTGICFIGERPFREFLARYIPKHPGEIRALDSDRVVGKHQGLMYYTLGQREGLGIGGVKGAPEEPWFVCAKDMAKNILYVVQGHAHPALMRDRLVARQLSWISGEQPHTHWVYAAKTRYRQPDAACEVESVDANCCEIAFAAPQWAVTPGQSVVVYESLVCLGGGIIE
ncbi:MAG: tRNA 2-thiouridine(34) synthase MnmA [Rhodocyclaceae bacterium]|jgi:tRNA-specific 2-thiouridylase|nr:tRNA 2-thiouridine(34) synthase MnmA [Rhodocyclaceae bacterium]MBK6553595.1 tRNA 2-thiouridine(34) synthase MnmA [Rhodocyclaceae bacterium]MBK9311128.1 tRNA 2-thiouridine(34) synthase MnmA [Rhodocyclaceae bacterium]MBK9956651.1 tRNA 2-thiouridine(34) synthase MnmA [Rhodocyclaceae bacterium]